LIDQLRRLYWLSVVIVTILDLAVLSPFISHGRMGLGLIWFALWRTRLTYLNRKAWPAACAALLTSAVYGLCLMFREVSPDNWYPAFRPYTGAAAFVMWATTVTINLAFSLWLGFRKDTSDAAVFSDEGPAP